MSIPSTITINNWYHIAYVRNGNTWYAFQDGVLLGSVSDSRTLSNSTSALNIGQLVSGSYLNGYMDELRITKGEALWTSDFSSSLPSGPGTAGANTKLLLHLDGDESNSNHPVTFNGNAQMISGGEFDGAYSFDGSGDYLSIPDSDDLDLADGDFTIDLWARLDSLANPEMLFAQADNWAAGPEIYLGYFTGASRIVFGAYEAGGVDVNIQSSGLSWNADTWYHFAVVRN